MKKLLLLCLVGLIFVIHVGNAAAETTSSVCLNKTRNEKAKNMGLMKKRKTSKKSFHDARIESKNQTIICADCFQPKISPRYP